MTKDNFNLALIVQVLTIFFLNNYSYAGEVNNNKQQLDPMKVDQVLLDDAVVKSRNYWPTKEWKYSSPDEQGMSSEKLDQVDQYMVENYIKNNPSKDSDLSSLIVVKNGHVVFEKYYSNPELKTYPIYLRRLHTQDVGKSIFSALIGIAKDKEQLNLDQTLFDYFPEYFDENTDPQKKEITIKQLLSLTSGFQFVDDWTNQSGVAYSWRFSPKPIKFLIDLPVEKSIKNEFNYNSGSAHALTAMLTEATKVPNRKYADDYLFQPLGIKSVLWKQIQKIDHTLILAAEDLARIGYLYLNNGVWDGEQIISKDWVKESTKIHSEHVKGKSAYGYQWWVIPVNGKYSYRAAGLGGQFIVVIPELDMVIVRTARIDFPLQDDQIFKIYSFPEFDLIAQAVEDTE